jgi:hypothetical protein
MARFAMSQSEDQSAAQACDLTKARQLLELTIAILSANGKGVAAAHAQMALDMVDGDSARLDPRFPD